MNALTEDEFNEFILSREVPINKLEDTGRLKEVYGFNPREISIESKESLLEEKARQRIME